MSCSVAAPSTARSNPRSDSDKLAATCIRARILAAEAAGDAAAKAVALADRDVLIASHWWLTRGAARSFHTSSQLDLDDLRGAAYETLVNAAELFDPERGVKFSTYLTHSLRNHLVDECRRQRRIAYVPRGAYGKDTPHNLRELVAKAENPARLDFQYDDGDGDGPVFGNLVLARRGSTGLDVDERDVLWEALNRLPPTWRQALLYRYWDGLKFKEIGRRLRVSATRAQQLEQAALEKIKVYLAPLFAPQGGTAP